MDDRLERVLRASVPEPYCNATSAVGGAQGYIAELEAQRDMLREALEDICDCIDETRCRNANDALIKARAALKVT